MTAPKPAEPLPWESRFVSKDTESYFSAPEDFGVYNCADDYEDAVKQRRRIIAKEMP